MALLAARVLDEGLWVLTREVRRIDLCSGVPADGEEATGRLSLAHSGAPKVSAPGDRQPSGRLVSVGAIADAEITADGVGTHWALTGRDKQLLAAGPLEAPVRVTRGNRLAFAGFDIGMPGAA